MPQTFNVGARSILVTAMAWVTIVVGLVFGLGAAGAHLTELTTGVTSAGPWALSAVVAMSLAAVITAAGLLVRLDWARRAFIGLLVLVIVAQLPGLWLQYEIVQRLLGDAVRMAGPLSPAVAQLLGFVKMAALGVAVVLGLAACALLVWMIRRLMSPSIRQEFA